MLAAVLLSFAGALLRNDSPVREVIAPNVAPSVQCSSELLSFDKILKRWIYGAGGASTARGGV
jgi:hypothetical protein